MPNCHSLLYRSDIDGLRALAILSVIGFHTFPNHIKSGFTGVDFFFVISGFLITGIILRSKNSSFNIFEFYLRRVRRIFPALIVILFAVLIFGYFILLPSEFRQLGMHIAGAGSFVANIMYWYEVGYFDPSAELKPLMHIWSLSVEEQFYLIWPLLILFCLKIRHGTLLAIISVILISFCANVFRINQYPQEVFFLPMARFWELAAGGLIYSWSNCDGVNGASRIKSQILAFFGLILLILSVFFLDPKMPFPGWIALTPVVSAVLIIAAGPTSFINHYLLSNPILVYLGKISYPVYLWHWPILSFCHIVYGESSDVKTKIAIIVSSLILGWLTYVYVDLPIKRIKSLVIPKLLLGLMVLIVACGILLYLNQGFPGRFPSMVNKLEAYRPENITEEWREHRCFLEPTDSGGYAKECSDTPGKNGPLIFIWGDSHAAAVYPGLKNLQNKVNFSFRLGQFTSSACPPFVNFKKSENPYCFESNLNTLNKISKLKPSAVILHANWVHPGYNIVNDDDVVQSHLAETVTSLRKEGVKKIILLGPVPQWVGGLPKTILAFYRADPQHRFPSRIAHTNDNVKYAETKLKSLASQLGVKYISALEILCSPIEGCIAIFNENDADITAFDYGHLTPAGSSLLIDGLKNILAAQLVN